MRRSALLTVVILFLAWLVDYVDRLVIPVALPAIGARFDLDRTAQGAILTAFFVAYALAQVPGGLLADRFGSRRVMTVSMALWSVFTALTGTAFSYVWLLAVRFVFGLFEGMFPGASMKAIAERTPVRYRLTANGAMLASNPLGAAVAPLVAAPAIALVGWQRSFVYLALPGLVMAAVIWWTLPDSNVGSDHGPLGRPDSLRLLGSGVLWRFVLMFLAYDIVAWGLVSWTPGYLIEERHVPLVLTGVLASIPWFGATVATVLGGVLFDRLLHERHRWLIVPSMALTAICLYLMLRTQSASGFIAWETVGVFFMSLATMPILGLPLRVLPSAVAGSAMALINVGGQIGGAVAPLIMGVLADNLGFEAAFGFLVASAGLTVAAAIWSPQTRAGFQAGLRLSPQDLQS